MKRLSPRFLQLTDPITMISPLLLLPREIRDDIHSYVFASPWGFVVLPDASSGYPTRRPNSLLRIKSYEPYYQRSCLENLSLTYLRVCKQIHAECKDLLWSYNALFLGDVRDWSYYLMWDSLALQLSKNLRHLRVDFNAFSRSRLSDTGKALQSFIIWSRKPGSSLRQVDFRLCRKDMRRLIRNDRNERQECVDTLHSAGTSETGFPAHVKRKLVVGEWFPPRFGWEEWSSPLNVKELMKPGQLLLQLHEAFKGEMWFDGVLYYENGVSLEGLPACWIPSTCLVNDIRGEHDCF